MSNFHEQNLGCIKFKISNEESINTFCNTLYSKKTPDDIFEKTELLEFERMYLPQYIFAADFEYICVAAISLLNDEGKKIGSRVDNTICGESSYLFCKRATNNDLSFIPKNFFPDYKYCIDNFSKEIELSPLDVLVCSENSLSWEKIFNSDDVQNYVKDEMKQGVYASVRNEISKQLGNANYDFYFTNEYKSDMSTSFDYKITDFSICSMLIPIYKILFKYDEKTYTVYVNGCNVKKGLLSNNEVYYDSLPVDTTKPKGLFAKISYNKAKKLHKEEAMEAAKKMWLEKTKKED